MSRSMTAAAPAATSCFLQRRLGSGSPGLEFIRLNFAPFRSFEGSSSSSVRSSSFQCCVPVAMRLTGMQENDAFIPACGVSVRASGSTAVVEPESLQEQGPGRWSGSSHKTVEFVKYEGLGNDFIMVPYIFFCMKSHLLLPLVSRSQAEESPSTGVRYIARSLLIWYLLL
jgi:hypothetical protein